MPTAIPFLLAAATATTTAVVIANLALAVGSLALSSYQKKKAKSKQRAAFDSAQVDRLANVPAVVAPFELVLGRVRKGGVVFFRGTAGAYKEKFFLCVALAAHEIDGIEALYFNDERVDFDGGGTVVTAPYARWVTSNISTAIYGSVTNLPQTPTAGTLSVIKIDNSGPNDNSGSTGQEAVPYSLSGNVLTVPDFDPQLSYAISYQTTYLQSFARVRFYLGGADQTADPGLMAAFPSWGPNHRARGVAYVVCEFDYDETAFPSSLPSVSVMMRGARCYDPRTGNTAFTENPAVMMRHVALHPDFGRRTAISADEDAQIIAAANASDIPIDYGSGSVPMFRAAGVFQFGTPARDIFDDMSQAMGGQWAYAGGGLYMRAGVFQAPVVALTERDLAVVQRSNDGGESSGQISISPHVARNEKVNTILPRIWDQAANYTLVAITPLRADALVAEDGAELTQEATMPAVFYAPQAWHIAGIMLRDGRDPLTVTAPFKLSTYAIQLFDTVTWTVERYGWVAKEFRVIGRTLTAEGAVQLTLKETSAAITQPGAPFLPQGYANNSGLPRPWDITAPPILSVTSGESELIVQPDGTIVNGILVTWAPVLDRSVSLGGHIDVEYTVVRTGTTGMVTVDGDLTSAVITGVQDNEFITLRTRARSDIAASDWSAQVVHQVIGKTEPPPDIINLSISGTVLSWAMPRRVPDLAGFVFRFHYGSNADWGSAAPLHQGVVTESPWEPQTRPGGIVTIMGKAIDTSGNLSKNAQVIVMNLGDAPIENIVEVWDFEAAGWPFAAGEQSGWTLVSGDPSANALDSLYGTDDQSFYGADNDSFYEAGAYGQMVFVTPEVSIVSALTGSIMTLEAQTQGTDVRIDYRLSGPGAFYERDNDSMYGPDDEPFYGQPGAWQPWPGQLAAANDVYQFRVTIGAGVERGILQGLVLTVDAPDIEEEIDDLPIAAGGTVIPYSAPFTAIKTVIGQLQANGSGAVTIEVDKTNPLAPVARAFNASHVSVSGASADFRLKGY